MKILWWLVLVLTVLGAINWGLVAFDFNLVEYLLGSYATAMQVVYVVIGVSGVVLFVTSLAHNCCKMCESRKEEEN